MKWAKSEIRVKFKYKEKNTLKEKIGANYTSLSSQKAWAEHFGWIQDEFGRELAGNGIELS